MARHRDSREHKVTNIASVLLAIFAVYYINITAFTHTHTIDGATILHSHIHGENHTDTPDSGHTKQSVTLISHLSNYVSLGVEVFHVDLTAVEVECYVAKTQSIHWSDSEAYTASSPRAPPVYNV